MGTVSAVSGRNGRLVLAAILLVYGAIVYLRAPERSFGQFHDDTLYAGAAQAIAQGRGYIVPSLPGEPPSTKYPPGYPYALAAVMAAFPAALEDPAKLWPLSAATGALALAVAFLYFQRWKGVGWTLAAAAVALCGSQQVFLQLSGAVLSDTPFMAMALAAFAMADNERRTIRALVGAAVLAGLAVLMRSAGVAAAAGITAWLLYRRDWRGAAVFSATVLPFALVGAVAKLTGAAMAVEGAAGFRQTWLYYTDYAGFWRASVPDAETLLGMLHVNFGMLLAAPAELCVGLAPPGQIGGILWSVITVAIAAGIIRQARGDRWRPIHFGLALTFPMVLLWNYDIADRLLLPFAPLFALGLCIELRHMAVMFGQGLASARPAGERVVSAVFLALIACFCAFAGQRTLRDNLAGLTPSGPSYDEKYNRLYDWLRERAQPDERFVAIDDGLFYLRTGRQGMWPLALTTEPRFRPDAERLKEQIALLPETAREIGARYVIQTDHDYAYAPMMQQRWREWTADLPVLVESEDGTARLLDLGDRLAGMR